jgi:FkbM family methyltransferase
MSADNIQRNLYRGTHIIGEHTIASMPSAGDKILDVGCRAYSFAKPMAELGCKVWAIEPDEDVKDPKHENITLIRTALVSSQNAGKKQQLQKWSSGEGNRLAMLNGYAPAGHKVQETESHSIYDICRITNVHFWKIVKLDCEGSEYEILLDWPGPIAEQITVEFHDFTGANPEGKKTYEKMFNHLGQWYDIVQHDKSVRYCCNVPNYWDSLLVLKDGINTDTKDFRQGQEKTG